jgi:hypothetical protein
MSEIICECGIRDKGMLKDNTLENYNEVAQLKSLLKDAMEDAKKTYDICWILEDGTTTNDWYRKALNKLRKYDN